MDFNKYYELNLKLTKKAIKDSIKLDNLVIQAVNSIEEIELMGSKKRRSKTI